MNCFLGKLFGTKIARKIRKIKKNQEKSLSELNIRREKHNHRIFQRKGHRKANKNVPNFAGFKPMHTKKNNPVERLAQ